MKKILFKTSFIAILLNFIACSNEDDNGNLDTQKPTIEIIKPTDHAEFMPGDVLNLEAILQDNVGLASYKIEIHAETDGHTHEKFNKKHEDEDHADWLYTETQTIDANISTLEIHKNITIPTTIQNLPITEGHYHLGIYVIDTSGNEQQQFIEIAIGEHTHD